MSLVDELVEISEGKPLPAAPRPVSLPEIDEERASAPAKDRYSAEGQSFFIEYEDAAGQVSRRRITVSGVRVTEDMLVQLTAYCHERRAARTFSVDGILCCVDFDGVVHDDVPEFLTGVFGIDLFSWAGGGYERRKRWNDFVTHVRDDAVLLATISAADGHVVSAETDAGLDHMLWTLEMSGRFPDENEVVALGRYLHRLRPNRGAIDRALRNLPSLGNRRVERILRACVQVMDADGVRRWKEISAINGLSREMIGFDLL